MALHLIARTPRLLLVAGLLVGVAAARAAGGYSITPRQEATVMPGMSESEVELALGHPAQDIQYRNEPGPTFTYHVIGPDPTLFDVEFGSDGKVMSAKERIDDSVN